MQEQKVAKRSRLLLINLYKIPNETAVPLSVLNEQEHVYGKIYARHLRLTFITLIKMFPSSIYYISLIFIGDLRHICCDSSWLCHMRCGSSWLRHIIFVVDSWFESVTTYTNTLLD